MVNIRREICPADKWDIKCPNKMTPTRIVIHNTANDAPAKNEISYMNRNKNEVSFHFAVDDTEIVQGIELDRNAWHSGDGNGKGNREGIAIEICYSKSGGEKWLKAVENAAELTAKLLDERGWGTDRVTKHQDYSGKHCPHRILDEYGWDKFLDLVKSKMKKASAVKPAAPSAPAAEKISVIYQVWDDVKNCWLPEVTDLTDYAGLYGHDVCAVYARLTSGNIFYKVHYKGGVWLPEVKNREDYAGLFNKPIDGLMMRTDTGKTVKYAVHLRTSDRWLPFVSGYDADDFDNGYAGIIGQEIDGVKIYIE